MQRRWLGGLTLHQLHRSLVTIAPPSNAVVLEKSSQDGADVNAQRIGALRTVTEQLSYDVDGTARLNDGV